VQFTATFLGGVAPFNYSWDLGDGATARGPEPNQSYSNPGTYSIWLWLNDSDGHSLQTDFQLVILSALSFVASASPNPTDVGWPVQFNSTSAGGVGGNATEWEFGDGTDATSGAPVHTYVSPGTFLVHASSTDPGGGQSNATLVERVNPTLAPPFIRASPQDPSLKQLVGFSVLESGGTQPYTFEWAFGDGTLGGDLSQIFHAYASNGPFEVNVTVWDEAGAMVESSLNLSVALSLTVSANASLGASPLPVQFGTQVVGGNPGYSYDWEFGDEGNSSAPSPAHLFDLPGEFDSTVRVTDSVGETASGVWAVDVVAGGGPLTAALSSGPPGGAAGQPILVTASLRGGAGAFSLTWGGSALGFCQSASVLTERCTVPSDGKSTLNLTVRDAGGDVAESSTVLQIGPSGSAGPTAYLGISANLAYTVVGIAALLAVIGIAVAARGPTEPVLWSRALSQEYRIASVPQGGGTKRHPAPPGAARDRPPETAESTDELKDAF
jgi:PKD repeat protein